MLLIVVDSLNVDPIIISYFFILSRIIICTSVRVLETQAARHGLPLAPGTGATDIFIYPGFQWKVTDALLTNFHLPQSTLIMLVSAFATRELILEAYRQAVAEKYRFFSYGDCMLIL